MSEMMTIVVATTNRGKLREIKALLADLPVEVVTTADVVGRMSPIVEDGDTFEANASKKAQLVAAATMMVTLADDSGLEVDALGGRPGVRSARFAKLGATDAENNAELLKQMQDVADEQRTARFRCAMVLVDPWREEGEREMVVQGSCEGHIAHKPTGAGGFGYDPLFILQGREQTMAELSASEKNAVSHRAKALAAIAPELEALVRRRMAEATELT